MPAKGKKGKKGKKKGKKKKMIGNETPGQVMKRLLDAYESQCYQLNSPAHPCIKSAMKNCVEDDKLLVKYIVEPVHREKADDPQVSIEPLLNAVSKERFSLIKSLYVWELPLVHEHVALIAQLLEKQIFLVSHLELMDCLISPYSVERLSHSFNACETLSVINLDYNEFGNEGCKGVCAGLEGNRTVISLSMCYCCLGVASGAMLGHIAATTAVREFYLDGNDLECAGAINLIRACVEQAEGEALEREEEAERKAQEEAEAEALKSENKYKLTASDSESEKKDSEKPDSAGSKKKKKKKKGKKKKGPPPPPPVGPWIYKLHLADNGIDAMGNDRDMALLGCMQLIKKFLMTSKYLEELDLEDNLIETAGGEEILQGLEARKEAKLPSVKLRTTHRMSTDVFNKLVKLGVAMKKKKKKRGKKKKK